MVKTNRPRRQALHNLPKAGQAGQLAKQQGPKMPLAGPGPITRADTAIATVRLHNPRNNTTIKRFQNPVKSAYLKRHGRPQNLVWRL